MEINLSVRDLKAFLAVAQTRSFSKAAQQVHLSQSALSALIARQEESLGARLFERSTRSVALTAAGVLLQERAQRLLADIADTLTAVKDVVELRRGRVAVACLPSLAAGLVPELFRQFGQRHPDIELALIDTLSESAFELVRSGRVDFALTAANPQYEDLDHEPLTTDSFVLLVPPAHALAAGSGELPLVEALAWPHVSMPRTASVRQYLDAAALQRGLQFRPRFEVDHLATIGAMVEAGLGVAALPALAAEVIGHRALRQRPLVEPVVRRSIGLVRRRGGEPSPAAQAMVDLLRVMMKRA